MDENISNTPQESASDREALMRELFVRLSTYPGDPRVYNPRLLVGQIPQGLPEEIPLPEQSRVLGTLIRGQEDATIVIDADATPQQLLDFYRQRLKTAGWQELELPIGPQQGGFVHSSFAFNFSATFCRGSHGPSLSISAFPKAGDGTTTDARLELDATGQQCMQQQKMSRIRQPAMYDLIPRLTSPSDAKQQSDGGGSGGDSVFSCATLVMSKDMEIGELVAHYNTQLESSGWTRNDVGSGGPFAWSTWSFRDEDNELWHGSFLILKMQTQKPQYTLYVQAKMDTGAQPSNGWFSSISLA